jgi:hypothetical protein
VSVTPRLKPQITQATNYTNIQTLKQNEGGRACCLRHQGARGSLIALKMEAASTSETSVHFNQTARRNNPEDSHLQTHRRENLKSQLKQNDL